MGGKNVKNTIVEQMLANVAPHYCCGCGKVGVLLCLRCKDNIVSEPFEGCFMCGTPARGGICEYHESPIRRSFIVSQRDGALRAVIDALKFQHAKAAARELAALLHARLPLLPENTVIVPIPTVRSHIRERGYDQVELIARFLGEWRNMRVVPLLQRRTTHTQHILDRKERLAAAEYAFSLNSDTLVVQGAPILLLDDIVTTGSTVSQAAEVLHSSHPTIFMAALAYQPLVKQ